MGAKRSRICDKRLELCFPLGELHDLPLECCVCHLYLQNARNEFSPLLLERSEFSSNGELLLTSV